MMRIKYPAAILGLLTWVIFAPPFFWGSLYVDIGCVIVAIVFVLVALVMRRWRALATLFVPLTVLIVGDLAFFAYRMNNICDREEHLIRSEAAAIKMAKALALSANYVSSHVFDDEPDLVEFRQTDDCCKATRTRTLLGVVVWEVSLRGETVGEMQARRVRALVRFSNCGQLFVDDSSISTVPKKVDSIWPTIK